MRELWVPLSGAIAQQRKVDTIANNVANSNTPGFKKDQLTFKEYMTTLQKGYDDIDLPNKEWAPADFYRSYGAENAMVEVDANYTNFEQGQLSPTGNTLDIGLRGKGFFEVLTPNGIRYSRRGIMSLNANGQLVNDSGFPILGKSTNANEPAENRVIQFPNGVKSISFTLQGDVYADNEKINALSINEFNDINALRKEGNSLFINNDQANLKQEVATSVHQGFVEDSNVNAVEEMSELIKAHRHFESIQNVIKTYDQISQKGVNEILKF